MKKSKLLIVFCVLAVVLLWPQTVLASDTSARAVKIAQTLTSYKVSPDWPPDLKSNTKLLDELKILVEGFNEYDVTALGTDKELVFEYYSNYCAAIDEKPVEIPNAANAQDMPSRESAVKILASLVRGQVNPAVEGDISANSADIEQMLTLVFAYKPEECAATPEPERESIKAYFVGLYEYKGWDTAELDLLFSASHYPKQTKAPAPQKYEAPNTPYVQDVGPIKGENPMIGGKKLFEDTEILTGLLAVALWLALFTGTVIVLKQRNEKHYGA